MTSRLEREEQLFEACRILFGNDIVVSREFLSYLQEDGVTSAFRKRALDVHPDKALVSGLSEKDCHEKFISLQLACETLRQHIASKKILARTPKSSVKVQKKPDLYHNNLPEEKFLFGRFLYRMGIIEWRQLVQALAWQKSSRPRIGELGIKLGYLNRNSVVIILKNSIKTGAFGVTAQKMGFLSEADVQRLLKQQKLQEKKIGQFFIDKGLLSSRELAVLLGQCIAHNRRIEMLQDG